MWERLRTLLYMKSVIENWTGHPTIFLFDLSNFIFRGFCFQIIPIFSPFRKPEPEIQQEDERSDKQLQRDTKWRCCSWLLGWWYLGSRDSFIVYQMFLKNVKNTWDKNRLDLYIEIMMSMRGESNRREDS